MITPSIEDLIEAIKTCSFIPLLSLVGRDKYQCPFCLVSQITDGEACIGEYMWHHHSFPHTADCIMTKMITSYNESLGED